MSKIEDMIREMCPEGVHWVKLGEVCEILDSQRRPVSKGAREKGEYPYYGANGIQDYVSGYLFDGKYLLVGEDGSVINKDNSPILNWAEGKIWVNNHAHILAEKREIALLRYLYFALQCTDVSEIVHGTPPKLNQGNLREIEIPLPPLPIQEKIVEILEKFSLLSAELEAELEGRRKQYDFYRNRLLSFDSSSDSVVWKTLGDIGPVRMCKRILKSETNTTGGIPFYKIGTFGKECDAYISQELFDEYKAKYSYPTEGTILLSAAGTIGKTVVFDGKPSYFQDSNIVWIENDESMVLNRYLLHFFKIVSWKVDDGGVVKRLYNDNLRNTPIPVPPLAEQERIVRILDKFEALVTDLSAGLPAEIERVQKQYEYYRNKLFTFPEA